MPTSLPHRPLAPTIARDEQIAYVTDNVRDAEALGSRTECQVVLERRTLTVASRHQTFQTSETPRRSKRPGVSNVSGVRDVSDVWSDSNVSDILNRAHVPNVSRVSDVPDVQTSNL